MTRLLPTLAVLLLCLSASLPASDRSPQWPAVRKAYLAQHRTCEACGAASDLQVHHVQPVHLWPALELVPSNLITLCPACHLRVGHLGDWKAFNPCVREDAAYWLDRVQWRPRSREEGEQYERRFRGEPRPMPERMRLLRGAARDYQQAG